MKGDRRPDGGHRVVVTGMGAVHGFGLGVQTLWDAVASGASSIRMVTLSRDGLDLTLPAAQVPAYAPADHFTPDRQVLLDPFAQYAVIACKEAVADAGLEAKAAALHGAAVIIGNGGGGELTREEAGVFLFSRRQGRVHPLTVPRTNHQAVVSHLAAMHGVTGPSYVVSTGCASGTHAIAQATWMVRHGIVSGALTGGCEASIIYSVGCAFSALRTIARDTCRPFSKDRSGFAFGEGAGILVLESLEAARARGARIHGEILGCGMSIDPSDQVQPGLTGAMQCLSRTLADAGRDATDIQYINAHGTGTVLNDRSEIAAIREVFGRQASRMAVSSTKSQLGHSFGASGALEAIVSLKALAHQVLPPTANWLGPDPDCDMDVVPNVARRNTIETVISESFGFGGVNAALAMGAL